MSVHGVHVVRISAAASQGARDSQRPRGGRHYSIRPAHASACQTPSHGVPGRADAVAEACLAEGRAPYIANARVQHRGRRGPPSFQRHDTQIAGKDTLRQRNLRELRLDQHLYQEAGHWHLHFSGDDLKIGHRGAQVKHVPRGSHGLLSRLPPGAERIPRGVSPLPPQSHELYAPLPDTGWQAVYQERPAPRTLCGGRPAYRPAVLSAPHSDDLGHRVH